MLLYDNVHYVRTPTSTTNVTFSCDDVYFQKYGINNIASCLTAGLKPHCHVINPTETTKKYIESTDSNLSFSLETLDIAQFDSYQLTTYYYCSRFFVALDLFDKFNVKELWISDTDVLFNSKPVIPIDKSLGISYNEDQSSLWKQTQASLIYIKQSKKLFIEQVLSTYRLKLKNTNFKILDSITDKYERGNILGLDQVCMSLIFKQYYKTDPEFINLHSIEGLKSKSRGIGAVTILVGKNKN